MFFHSEKKIEILFDFPYRGTEEQWFPTWMGWPARDPEYEHTSAEYPKNSSLPQLIVPGLTTKDEPWLYVHGIWAISNVLIRTLSDLNEYEIKIDGMVVGFYCPYVSQAPITATIELLTLAIIILGHTYNWVVCKERAVRSENCKMADGNEKIVEIHVLKKIGVLRTDSSGELLVGLRNTGPVVKNINALFV